MNKNEIIKIISEIWWLLPVSDISFVAVVVVVPLIDVKLTEDYFENKV